MKLNRKNLRSVIYEEIKSSVKNRKLLREGMEPDKADAILASYDAMESGGVGNAVAQAGMARALRDQNYQNLTDWLESFDYTPNDGWFRVSDDAGGGGAWGTVFGPLPTNIRNLFQEKSADDSASALSGLSANSEPSVRRWVSSLGFSVESQGGNITISGSDVLDAAITYARQHSKWHKF